MSAVVCEPAANSNRPARPLLVLHATGNGLGLYRALARILVRRELICAGVLPANDLVHTDSEKAVADSLGVA